MAEWSRGKSAHFLVTQGWELIAIGWEACLGTPDAATFPSFSHFHDSSDEIFVKEWPWGHTLL